MYSDAGILSQRSLSNDYNTQDGLYNNSNGQSGKNRGSKFHVHTLPVKNSFYQLCITTAVGYEDVYPGYEIL